MSDITVFNSKNVSNNIIINSDNSVNNYGIFNQSFTTDAVTRTVTPSNIYIDTSTDDATIYVKDNINNEYVTLFGTKMGWGSADNLKLFSTIPQHIVIDNYTLRIELSANTVNKTIFCRHSETNDISYTYVDNYIVAVNGIPINVNHMSISNNTFTFNSLFSVTTDLNLEFNNVAFNDIFNTLDPRVLQRIFSKYNLPTMTNTMLALNNKIEGLRLIVKELCGRCYSLTTEATKEQINEMYNRYDIYSSGYTPLITVPTNFNFATYTQKQYEDANYWLFDMQPLIETKRNNLSSMMINNKQIINLDLSSWNMSNVINMTQMFFGCTSLETLNLTGFVTSSVTNLFRMMFDLYSATSIVMTDWDTSEVTNMAGMFAFNLLMKQLDLSNFVTQNVTNMSNMFEGCRSLVTIDLSGKFTISDNTSTTNMFNGCNALKYVYYSAANKAKLQSLLPNFDDGVGPNGKPALVKQ